MKVLRQVEVAQDGVAVGYGHALEASHDRLEGGQVAPLGEHHLLRPLRHAPSHLQPTGQQISPARERK